MTRRHFMAPNLIREILMNRIPIPSFNQRISALLFLLFCGCMEVLGMTPEAVRQLPVHSATELVEGSTSVSKGYIRDALVAHCPTVVHFSAHPVCNSFSATLRKYVAEISTLIRWQERQFLLHKVIHLRQVALAEAARIDLPEGRLATAC